MRVQKVNNQPSFNGWTARLKTMDTASISTLTSQIPKLNDTFKTVEAVVSTVNNGVCSIWVIDVFKPAKTWVGKLLHLCNIGAVRTPACHFGEEALLSTTIDRAMANYNNKATGALKATRAEAIRKFNNARIMAKTDSGEISTSQSFS